MYSMKFELYPGKLNVEIQFPSTSHSHSSHPFTWEVRSGRSGSKQM
jgi:hypothetical protein